MSANMQEKKRVVDNGVAGKKLGDKPIDKPIDKSAEASAEASVDIGSKADFKEHKDHKENKDHKDHNAYKEHKENQEYENQEYENQEYGQEYPNQQYYDLASTHTLSEDQNFAAALTLQFQLEKEEEQRIQQIKNDHAIALQFFDNQRDVREILDFDGILIKLSSVDTKKLWTAIQTLTAILSSPAVASVKNNAEITNAHAYTRTFIREGLPQLIAIDDKFNLSETKLSLDALEKEVTDVIGKQGIQLSDAQMQNLKKTFSLVRGTPGVESTETNAHVTELMSRVWTLAKLCGMGTEYLTLVAMEYCNNIEDGGGCMAGLVARLYPHYARMLDNVISVGVGIIQRKYEAWNNYEV